MTDEFPTDADRIAYLKERGAHLERDRKRLGEQLEQLRALSAAAAGGKWYATDSGDDGGYPDERSLGGQDHLAERRHTLNTDQRFAGWRTDGGYDGYGMRREDAEFAAACVNFVRSLLGEAGEKA
jgi:hypothetical protein